MTTERARFRFPLPIEDVDAALAAAYAQIVASRGRTIENAEATKANITCLAKWLTDTKQRPMLLLQGGIGNGKTTTVQCLSTAIAMLRQYADNKLSKDKWQMSHGDILQYEALRAMPLAMPTPATEIIERANDNGALANMKRCQLLIIDDLGTEPAMTKIYGTEATPIVDIICYRYEKQMATIITTNLNDKAIAERYGARVADRLTEAAEKLVYKLPSYRTKR